MSKWTWGVWCLALLAEATAAPSSRQPVKVLYHERLALAARAEPAGHRHISFEAYGRRFELSLEPNEGIGRGVPASRSDIQPLQGKLDGQPGSWARLTQIRGVWRGVISDGHELYAIEPASEVAAAAVQPPETTDRSAPLIYRFSDTLMSVDGGLCGTGESVDSAISLAAYNDVATTADQSSPLQLTVSVVADHAFATAVGDDPEGAVIARMDIVDGIFSSQVGVRIVLAPIVVFSTLPEPFSATSVPLDLLAEVRRFRATTPSQLTGGGVTHLMTGRDLDGTIVGIAYLDSVCTGAEADSLSQGNHSTTMSALIAAHELGHNFNAPHDGQPGACLTTPQTFLMAPRINFSSQFSQCSLTQISARITTAQCLASSTGSGSSDTGGNGGRGRIDIALLALLGTLLIARRAQLLLRLLAGIPSDAKAVEVHQDPRRRRRGTRHRNDGLPRIRLAARHRAH
jgi:hypothetical protein